MIGIIISKNLRADYSRQRRINEKSFLEESFLKFFLDIFLPIEYPVIPYNNYIYIYIYIGY